MPKKINYAKEAKKLRDQKAKEGSQREMSFDEPSFYSSNGFSCRPSYNTQMKYNCCFDPYEPYNENVFESNEDNVLDDAEYVYDYLN